MGYYASGFGDANLKNNIDINKIESEIKALNLSSDFQWEINTLDNTIYFNEATNRWDELTTDCFLKTISPYITEGIANYSGEENDIWRYVYNPEEERWYEEDASIDYNFENYSDEELIEELENRGYIVTKKKGGK